MAGTTLSNKDQRRFLKRALLAANWFEYSQLGKERTEWDADYGRFLYYYNLPKKKHVPGISWTQARAIFVLTDAYTATKKRKYLDSAALGARYLVALQVMDPFHKALHGAFMYRTPQGPNGGSLDGSQSASALLMLESITRDPEYLRRAKAFADFILRTYAKHKTIDFSAQIHPKHRIVPVDAPRWHCVQLAGLVSFWHLYRRTRNRKLLPLLRRAANQALQCQRADGALQMSWEPERIPPKAVARENHHWGHGRGADKIVLRNDDGLTVVLLAAYKVFNQRKYLDAAVAYADWIVNNEPRRTRPYCSFPCQAGNVLDIGRVARRSYQSWVMDHLEERLLSLQNLERGDRRGYGGFRGEDEVGTRGGIFGGKPLDYVTTRTTCYAAGTLFRLSGQGTGSGFSELGLRTK